MRVLITGGTGFIGSRLAMCCAADGQFVRVLAQQNTPAEQQNCRELSDKGIEITEGSVTDLAAMRDATRDTDVVYHLAAAQHEASVADQHFYDVNVDGTRNIVREAIWRDIFLVHISTDYVFEGVSGGYAEDDPVGPVRNYYSLSKLAASRTIPRIGGM